MNRACQTRILKRGGIALSAFHFMRNLGRFDTADPIGNSGERMAVELSGSKTGAELLLLLRFAIGEGRGALSEIKRVVNIPGCNNNLVRNVRKEFSPRGETFTHFPPSHSTRCIIRWKTAGGSRLVGLLSLRMIDEGRS